MARKPASAITGMVTKPNRSTQMRSHGADTEHEPVGRPGSRSTPMCQIEIAAPMTATGAT
jgi:hypothetical protein